MAKGLLTLHLWEWREAPRPKCQEPMGSGLALGSGPRAFVPTQYKARVSLSAPAFSPVIPGPPQLQIPDSILSPPSYDQRPLPDVS